MNDINKNYLGIPIYLDTNTLLDLLASCEDGFSVSNKIVTKNDKNNTENSGYGGDFGINLFSLFNIGLKGSKINENSENSQKQLQEERFHTSGSLMNKLIKILDENNIIKSIDDVSSWESINESDFIKFEGKFIPPFENQLIKAKNLFEFIINSQRLDMFNNSNNTKDISNSQELRIDNNINNSNNNDDISDSYNFDYFQDIIDTILEDIKNEHYKKYTIEFKPDNSYKIFCALFNNFMRDRVGVELPYGEFTVVGKVIRIVDEGSINLLEDTSIGLSEDMINSLTSAFEIEELDFSKIYTSVDAPAIQIIPVAIYV